MSIVIRPATQHDLASILVELKTAAESYNTHYKMYGSDQEFTKELVSDFIDRGVFYVALDDSQIVGFICGLLSPHIYNPDITCLTQFFWWVDYSFRSQGVGRLLIEQFIEYGNQHADWIIGVTNNLTPIDDKVFTDRGFVMKDKTFVMEVK